MAFAMGPIDEEEVTTSVQRSILWQLADFKHKLNTTLLVLFSLKYDIICFYLTMLGNSRKD